MISVEMSLDSSVTEVTTTEDSVPNWGRDSFLCYTNTQKPAMGPTQWVPEFDHLKCEAVSTHFHLVLRLRMHRYGF